MSFTASSPLDLFESLLVYYPNEAQGLSICWGRKKALTRDVLELPSCGWERLCACKQVPLNCGIVLVPVPSTDPLTSPV